MIVIELRLFLFKFLYLAMGEARWLHFDDNHGTVGIEINIGNSVFNGVNYSIDIFLGYISGEQQLGNPLCTMVYLLVMLVVVEKSVQ